MHPRVAELRQHFTNALLADPIDEQPAELYEPISYILSLGGKRLRPLMVLLGTELFGGDTEAALPAAKAVEWFHNFTLLHDDIMDKAPLRRGKPTVHEKWDPNIAILTGDVMLVKCYDFLLGLRPDVQTPVIRLFNATAVEVCEGQQLDMNFGSRTNVTVDEYLHMIGHKTSALLAAALKMGALIAGANETDAGHLYQFGRNIGIAFQLHDDYLDVYGDQAKVGKQVGGDILFDKKTFLWLTAEAQANDGQRTKLHSYIGMTDPDKVRVVKGVYDELGIPAQTREKMNVFYDIAMKHLEAVEVASGRKAPLQELARSLMQREH